MAITVNWATKVIFVPENEPGISTVISASSPTIYEYDLDALRLALKDIEDSPEGIPFLPMQSHVAPFTIGNVQLARVIGLINGYTIELEDGQYQVNYVGANTDFSEATNRVINQVSVTPQNSAGLITTASTIDLISAAVWNTAVSNHAQAATMGRQVGGLDYDGALWIDTEGGGSAGSAVNVNGTRANPVDNLSDLLTLQAATQLTDVRLKGVLTLTEDVTGLSWRGVGVDAVLIVSGYEVTDSTFREMAVVGPCAPSIDLFFQNVPITGMTFQGIAIDSQILGTTTIVDAGVASPSSLINVIGASSPTVIDFDSEAVVTFSMLQMTGLFEFRNLTSPSAMVPASFGDGALMVGATNTAGTVLLSGGSRYINIGNGGTTVDDSGTASSIISSDVVNRQAYMKRDNITYNDSGFPVNGRERVFPTKALADAATYGGVGEGETDTYTITATPDGTFPAAPRTFDRIRDT